MKIAVLGSGMVGHAIATKLVSGGHQVIMGSRTTNSEGGQKWLHSVHEKGECGTFADAAVFAEILFDCTNGENSLAALRMAGTASLRDKILIQISNPLDFSKGMPPSLSACNTDSLGEQIQREFPGTRVVKALGTMNCEVMVQPDLLPEDHTLFIAGNDAAAKREVMERLAEWFGWARINIVDLGDIAAARGTEMFLPLWLRLASALGTYLLTSRSFAQTSARAHA